MALLNQKYFSPQSLSCSYRRLTSMQMGLVEILSLRLAITLVWKVQFQPVKHFYVACNELIHMAHLNQKYFSPQSLSCSCHRLSSMQMGLVEICSTSISHNFGLEGQIPTSQHFYVACNDLIHMAHLNQKYFSPQSLSCSYRRLTSMQMGLVEICSTSICHNFGLEGPIPTSQAFFR